MSRSEPKFTPGPWFYGIAYEPERGPVPFDYKSGRYSSNPGIIGANGVTVVGCDEYHVFNNPEDARLLTAAPALYEALLNVRGLIAEAAMTGFNHKDGDWAERLFASQQRTSAALKLATEG